MVDGHIELVPGHLSLPQLRALYESDRPIRLAADAWSAIERSADAVGEVLAGGRATYGVNTGFGSLATTRIPAESVATLQRNLVLSHAAGTGPLVEDRLVRLILILKINSLGLGYSGIRRPTLELLIELVNRGILPCVPSQGSVGASGDLAPLAHLTLPLIGEGEVRVNGVRMPAAAALAEAGLQPVTLGAKEGLALLNGTQASTGFALAGLFAIEHVLAAGLVSGAMSVDAMLGSDAPFEARIHVVRGQIGQGLVAEKLAALLAGSEIRNSHLNCDRVQDPYSLRCQPQVMGAVLDLMSYAAGVLRREANGVSDNPLVFRNATDGTAEIVSGGNFHAEPVAFAADALAMAVAEIGSISERRMALLVDAKMSSGLPAFLVAEPGLNSGFMIAQVTSSALTAENKMLAHPASVDSLPTSANQEDHVSMAAHGARRLGRMAENAAAIVGIELLAAAQGIDFRTPLQTSPRLAEAMAAIRARVPFLDRDRIMAPDMAAASALVGEGWFRRLVPGILPSE
ncbi:histidine ammonia-lyase [Aliidongia dinghuensis]|uniref:Histidine ammonia-lyase n=1 Tax=Aliidongia dinghuensis TaxID=1867774 RepID=A0A8J2YT11_9PROT|nr:histidine ammonia-lyase [Aliidongia dinghuensis]GGF13902.1 histidine ammonia-lyase [Aliidongia dinghuensis]